MSNQLLDELAQAVIDADPDEVCRLAAQALETGVEPLQIVENGLVRGITIVGDQFGSGELWLPELLQAAQAMEAGMREVEGPLMASGAHREGLGTVVLGTVKGDLHDLGKNLVGTMLKVNGFEVIDLGVDVPTEMFVEQIRKNKAQIVGLSALLTTTIDKQAEIIEALQANGMRDSVKVLVGGAPISAEWAKRIGADAFGANAMAAVNEAKKLVGVA